MEWPRRVGPPRVGSRFCVPIYDFRMRRLGGVRAIANKGVRGPAELWYEVYRPTGQGSVGKRLNLRGVISGAVL